MLYYLMNSKIKNKTVIKIMKSSLKFLYQKVQLKQIIAEVNKLKLLRKIFLLNLNERLNLNTLIINWDEFIISRSTKTTIYRFELGL